MKFTILFSLLTWSLSSFGNYGLLGRDQCPYQTSTYQVSQQDYQYAQRQQVQNLQGVRVGLEQRMNQINQELTRMQNNVRYYFDSPWSDTMLAHMDNGLDCCAASTAAVSKIFSSGNRIPAGSDYVAPPSSETTVEPEPAYQPPANSNYQPPNNNNSCQGYSSTYCTNDWGTNPYPNSKSGLCLQTGFAATPAWYAAACRNGGIIDPQVCGNAKIAKTPSDYQQCMQLLNSYYQLSSEKRRIASQIQSLGNDTYAIRNPQQPYQQQNSGYGNSETTNGVGNLLGVVAAFAPLVLNQYLNYQNYKNTRYNYNNYYQPYYPRPPYNSYRPPFYAVNNNYRPYYSNYQPPPPYYGPRYGYPYSYAGNYGGLSPALQLGGFGCGTGLLGGGLNLLGLLNGGQNYQIGSQLGPYAGDAPYYMNRLGYGNQSIFYPPHTYGGYTPPYQYGGIYNNAPGYYNNQNRGYPVPFASFPLGNYGYGGNYQNTNNGYLSNYGQYAYFQSRINDSYYRLNANQSYSNYNNYNLNSLLYPFLQYGAGGYAGGYGNSYGNGNYGYGSGYGGGYGYQNQWAPILQTLLLGGSLRTNFNLNSYGGY